MRSAKRLDIVITVFFTFAILFSSPVLIEAQVGNPANISSTAKIGVKIVSSSGNNTVTSGPLAIYGVSSDTNKTNCKVYVDWNDLKPMQNVTAKGLGGESDYSNWTYTYTEKYHTIAPGVNELTSKITCFDNPNNITSKYYSINITGLKNNTVSPTLPTSSNMTTFGYHNLGYLPQYDGFYHDIFLPTIEDESLKQGSSDAHNPNYNNDESKDDGNNDDSDANNNDNTNNGDSAQTSNHSESSSQENEDDNDHSKGRTHNSGDKEKKHEDNHEKEHNHKNHNSEKHKGAHSKKAHK